MNDEELPRFERDETGQIRIPKGWYRLADDEPVEKGDIRVRPFPVEKWHETLNYIQDGRPQDPDLRPYCRRITLATEILRLYD